MVENPEVSVTSWQKFQFRRMIQAEVTDEVQKPSLLDPSQFSRQSNDTKGYVQSTYGRTRQADSPVNDVRVLVRPE
jgi:hypothetical protein